MPGMVAPLSVFVLLPVLCPLICHNGGVCVKPDRCLCPPDFAGKFCQLHSSGARPPAPAIPGLTRSVYTMPLANHRDDEHGEESVARVPPTPVKHFTVPLTLNFPAFQNTFAQLALPRLSSPSP